MESHNKRSVKSNFYFSLLIKENNWERRHNTDEKFVRHYYDQRKLSSHRYVLFEIQQIWIVSLKFECPCGNFRRFRTLKIRVGGSISSGLPWRVWSTIKTSKNQRYTLSTGIERKQIGRRSLWKKKKEEKTNWSPSDLGSRFLPPPCFSFTHTHASISSPFPLPFIGHLSFARWSLVELSALLYGYIVHVYICVYVCCVYT